MPQFRPMPLTPEELATIIERLDAVCCEAQELQATLRRAMLRRAREQQQIASNVPTTKVAPERRVTPRNRRSAERRKTKPRRRAPTQSARVITTPPCSHAMTAEKRTNPLMTHHGWLRAHVPRATRMPGRRFVIALNGTCSVDITLRLPPRHVDKVAVGMLITAQNAYLNNW
jgi:hypothetical protein